MLLNKTISLLVLFLFCSPITASTEELTPIQVAEKLQAKYNLTVSMSADFTQVTSSQMSRRQKHGRGSLLLLKPGKMRWDYSLPDRQVVVCNGEQILMYFARENQVLISPARQYLESDITYSFFAGTGNLLRDFEVGFPEEMDLPTAGTNETALRIVPKGKHPQVDYIILWTDVKFQVNRLLIVDQFGSSTDIRLENIQLNSHIAEGAFSFIPPEGTEIIRQ